VFPRAILYAMPATVASFLIKYYDVLNPQSNDLMQSGNGTVYSGFTFVLGFILVFRTSQSYSRYWTAATAVHTMRSEWFDACGSLIAFSQMCKTGVDDISTFSNKMVRLFGLLHAMALEEIASLADENFPLIDVDGLDREDLRILTTEAAQGRKVEIIIQWIKVLVLQSLESEVLNVPAPILTRVFQEMGSGLVHYHEALQIVIWPFPFPYAQMSAVLVGVYMVVTPLVINLWTEQAWYCAVATCVSIVCMKGMDLISGELENPFGDDPNDLPCFQMHHTMNKDLVLLLNPTTWTIPRLLPTAITDYKVLESENLHHRNSLQQFYSELDSISLEKTWRSGWQVACRFLGSCRGMTNALRFKSKLDMQNEWAKQSFHKSKMRSAHMLGMDYCDTEKLGQAWRKWRQRHPRRRLVHRQ